METDIRMMLTGLRPVAEFRSNVERTIEVLNERAEDIFAADEEDEQERETLGDLIAFWERVLEGMGD